MNERTHSYWFETQGSYDGQGTAVFTSPHGRIEGPTRVTFDERGVSLVEMTLERVECERELKLSQFEFFSGREPRENGNAVILSIGADENPCSKLIVKSPRGTFAAEGQILYSLSYGQHTTVRFHPVRSQFDSATSAAPKFWVLPIYNFVSRFLDYDPILDDHALNVQLPSSIEDPAGDLEGEPQPNDHGLILFVFNDRPAFIKPLPDYHSRAAQLETERRSRVITAVVVGEMSTEGMDFAELERWLPLNIMGLLGLATGTLIAAPWVEFRDCHGLLVRRGHVSMGIARFIQGHRSIDEVLHHGTGRLLTRALASGNFNKDYLHASTRHLILAGAYDDTTVEDKLTHLARAIDCICHELGITGYNILDQLNHSDHKKLVKQEIQAAAKRIEDLANAVTDRGDVGEGVILKNISDRTMSNPAYRVNNFGAALRMLLKESGFADADVLDRYFSAPPRHTGESWGKTAVHVSREGDPPKLFRPYA